MVESTEKYAVIVCGSRTWEDKLRIKSILNSVKDKIEIVVAGGARGADRLAEESCKELGIKCKVMKADWDRHGKSAGYRRNEEMLKYIMKYPNKAVLAFRMPGESKGTDHMIKISKEAGVLVKVYNK